MTTHRVRRVQIDRHQKRNCHIVTRTCTCMFVKANSSYMFQQFLLLDELSNFKTSGKESIEIVNDSDCCIEMKRVSAKWNEVGIRFIMIVSQKRFKELRALRPFLWPHLRSIYEISSDELESRDYSMSFPDFP